MGRQTTPRRRSNPLPVQGDGDGDGEDELLQRYERSTGNYHLTVWEEQADDDVRGIIEVVYIGPFGGGPPVRLEYYLDDEQECDLFDRHRESRGDYDVREALLHFGYDEYTNNPRTAALAW